MNLSLQDLIAIWGPSLAIAGFMRHHSSTRFEKMDEKFEKMDEKITGVEKRLDEKITGVEKRLDEKITGVEKRLGEKIDAVRDRVSRIEGQLAPASFVTFNQPTKSKENIRSTHSS